MSHTPAMTPRQAIRPLHSRSVIAHSLTILVFWVASVVTQVAFAADIQLAWDSVSDSRVAYYEVHHGLTSGAYADKVTTTATTATVAGLTVGQTYYFAARACEAGGANCSPFSNEVSTVVPGTPPALAITTASLANGTVGLGYSATLTATGGVAPYSWSIASGSLPSGLTLNSTTGVISGTPALVATANFTVRVRDSASAAATSSKALSISVAAAPTSVTIWPSTAVPGVVDGGADSSVELGVKFRSDVAGTVTGIRFYKASTNTGTHVGSLWSSTGTQLATVTFTNETASGWQQANFSTPVAIAANTVYVVSYHANNGHYGADQGYFATTGVDNPPLHALANGVSGGNGVYAYGTSSVFPNQTWNTANYWVDVVFSPASAPTLQSIAVTPSSPTLAIGATQQFTATGSYSDGTTQNLTAQASWTSANATVVSIGSGGVATGVAAGQATISATLAGVTGKSGNVQVLPPAPVAEFAASTQVGVTPLTTTFSCKSTGEITARRWDFGDGTTGTAATAVHTYTTAGSYTVSLWVSGPGGEDTEVKSAFITVNTPAPVAGFSADVRQGSTPLAVNFRNDSTGQFTASTWSFGDGATSTQTHPAHTYTQPGLYPVTLTVSGPGGANTLTRNAYIQVDGPELPMEIGELTVNDQWQRVDFQTPFADPIVVATPIGNEDGAPAVVRVHGVDSLGFWIRVQEWDYLDGRHGYETVSYMAMERGRHQLPDGAWVEAGRLPKGNIAMTAAAFTQPFAEVPVVFATVTSIKEADAVVARLHAISVTGFQFRMQEQQANKQKHLPESIDYIAWEPSFGVVNGLRYEVGTISGGVSSKIKTVVYQAAFTQSPLFLADLQTTNVADPANLRWANRNEVTVDLWVSEEQSKDTEVGHQAEATGYFAAEEQP